MAGLQGRVFGGYQLVEQMPAGGIADVYRGRSTRSGGRDVVVKVIYPEFARQPGFLPRFRHIVQSSSKLASHPHVLPLLAQGEDAGYLYLITPFVEGGSLRDWQRNGGRMGPPDAAPFFRQLCDAISYAHSLGIVHGNLKPSNIFLFEGRHVLLGDFGLLWDVSQMDMNHSGSGADAVEYLAPEVLSGQVTQLGDIYSIGALLYSAAAGHSPFHGGKPADVFAAHAQRPVPSLAPAAAAFDPIVQRAMAKRPEDRYPSAAAVAQAIDIAARQPQAAVPSAFIPGSVPGAAPTSAGSHLNGPSPHPLIPPGFAPVAALPAFGAPPAGPSAGLAGATLGGMAGAMPSAGLTQLDPPFPPLPASAHVEEQMEQGRFHPQPAETGTQATVRVPAPPPASPPPASAELPIQPTIRVPATGTPLQPAGRAPSPAAPAAASSLSGLLESSPRLPAVPPVPPSAPPPDPASPDPRPYRISGAPAARLGKLPGSANLSPAPDFAFDDEDDAFGADLAGHQMLPAIRPGAAAPAAPVAPHASPSNGFGPPPAGFAVAGGSGPMPGSDGASAAFGSDHLRNDATGWTGEQSAFALGASREWRLFDGSTSGLTSGESNEHDASGWGRDSAGYGAAYDDGNSFGDRSAEFPAHDHDAFASSAPAMGSGDRPFSPTKLDLPRLTSPVLLDQPPSYHDILSESSQFPRFDAGVAVGERPPTWADAGEGMWSGANGGAAPLTPWRSNPPSAAPAAPPEWAGANAGAWDAAPPRGGALPPPATPWDSPDSASDFAPAGKRGRFGRRGKRDEIDDDSGFDDERVWTVGTTAVHAGRRRGVRKVALFLLLVLLVDMAVLVVVRPDLCPTAGCKQVSAYIHKTVPFLRAVPAIAPAPLLAVPAAIALNVTSGKSGTIPLVVTNTGKADITWKAATTLSWLTPSPAAGTLAVGAHQALTVTAKPIGVKPGSYTTTLILTTPVGDLTVPVTVAVAAGPLLTVSPTSLTYDTCGTAQTVTLANGGAAPLSFTAVPSDTSALSLDTTSGSLGPGQSRTIGVTLLCGASTGTPYTVNVISNSGSAVVTIRYT